MVRFRKGAPRSGAFFDTDLVTSPSGIPAEEQVSGSAGSRSPRETPGSGWCEPAARAGGCVPWGALWGARSLPSGLEGRVRCGVRPLLASYFAGFAQARRRLE